MPTIAKRPANEMTTRARWYLGVASTRHLLVGGFALLMPATYKSPSFGPLIDAAPLWFWGLVFIGAGVACGLASVLRHEGFARLGMGWSATSTLIVGSGLMIAIFTHDLSSPTGPIIWLAVAFKDFVVCAQPIRSPFEGLAEQMARKTQQP